MAGIVALASGLLAWSLVSLFHSSNAMDREPLYENYNDEDYVEEEPADEAEQPGRPAAEQPVRKAQPPKAGK